MICDLHLHSSYSDGTYTPRELISFAKSLGISALALTDHNTVAGVSEFMSEGEKLGVAAVAGVELSTVYKNYEIHLLGLFLPMDRCGDVTALMRKFHILKEASNVELVNRLNEDGYRIDYESVKRRNLTGSVNRAHIAAELTECGYVGSVSEAFKTLLNEKMGYYHPPERLNLLDAIKFLRSIKALPVLAHPLLDLDESDVRGYLPCAIDAGLLGIEVTHSSFDEKQRRTAERLACEFKLLPSGGSDFHGDAKPDVSMGSGKGNVRVPLSFYEALAAAAAQLQS